MSEMSQGKTPSPPSVIISGNVSPVKEPLLDPFLCSLPGVEMLLREVNDAYHSQDFARARKAFPQVLSAVMHHFPDLAKEAREHFVKQEFDQVVESIGSLKRDLGGAVPSVELAKSENIKDFCALVKAEARGRLSPEIYHVVRNIARSDPPQHKATVTEAIRWTALIRDFEVVYQARVLAAYRLHGRDSEYTINSLLRALSGPASQLPDVLSAEEEHIVELAAFHALMPHSSKPKVRDGLVEFLQRSSGKVPWPEALT